MWQEKVYPNAPYDFQRVLARLAVDPLVNLNLEKSEIYVPLEVGGENIVVHLKSLGQIEKPQFLITCSRSDVKQEILTKLAHIFQWDMSLEEVNNHFSNTKLHSIFTAYRGTPLVCDFDLYRCLMKTIIHQQLNLKFAHILTERFVKEFGKEIEGTWFYPTAGQVSVISYESLRKLQFSQRKAEYIIDTSKLIANGQLQLEQLEEMNSDQVITTLTKIRGIGPWTARSLLLFGLGRKDQLPANDIGIQNALKKLFDLEKKPTVEQINDYANTWAPFESYASLYLWESLGNQTVNNS
ncbi:DNA-3-methyladenine glycosylase family protein [Anaerobacillus sp. MEB173]|uniref:DNA-3-methyladenine glycosylase family protein n=1 Tax=Anaerobacillus sp. MEB173 TaxID=3383345 RepID=UPI003F92874C